MTNEEVRFGFLCPRHAGQLYGGHLEDFPESWLDGESTGALLQCEPVVP